VRRTRCADDDGTLKFLLELVRKQHILQLRYTIVDKSWEERRGLSIDKVRIRAIRGDGVCASEPMCST
jgi:hypothetical protein